MSLEVRTDPEQGWDQCSGWDDHCVHQSFDSTDRKKGIGSVWSCTTKLMEVSDNLFTDLISFSVNLTRK